jgi:hypothetical protein
MLEVRQMRESNHTSIALQQMVTLFAVALLGLLLPSKISGQQTPDASKSVEGKVAYQQTGKEATLVGRVLFNGQPPPRKLIETAADPACASAAKLRTEDVLKERDGGQRICLPKEQCVSRIDV